jgi:hypothetical protein
MKKSKFTEEQIVVHLTLQFNTPPYRSQRGYTLRHLAKACMFCSLGMLMPISHSLEACGET